MKMDTKNNLTNVPIVPDFPFKMAFETRFDTLGIEDFLQEKYHHSFYYTALYLLAIPLGQALMKNRNPLDLRWILLIWNSLLAMMSFGGAVRTVPELFHSLLHFGMKHSICDDRYYYVSPVMACWSHVIVVSKVVELFDTLFIVLRKQKLIFLHWFHHSSVLIFTWVIAKDRCAITRWFMSMNYAIHMFMYAYYAFRVLKVSIPRRAAMFITTVQIVQMFVGFYVSFYGFFIWYSGSKCALSGRVAIFGTALYTFYFVLFANFFFRSYMQRQFKRVLKAD